MHQNATWRNMKNIEQCTSCGGRWGYGFGGLEMLHEMKKAKSCAAEDEGEPQMNAD
jgi:hypothetical protein